MSKVTASKGRSTTFVFVRAALAFSAWVLTGCVSSDDNGRLIFETEWGGRGERPGQFFDPSGIDVGPDGRVYVADSGNARLQVFTPDGEHLATWPLPNSSRPTGLVVRADGVTLVADFTGDRILVLGADGTIQDTWAGGTDDVADLAAPSGIALTPSGTVVVVEFMGQQVRELDSEGRFLRFIDGGSPAATHVTERRPIPGMEEMAAGRLYAFPSDAVVAPNGTLYVTNTHAYEVLVFGPNRELAAGWGTKGAEPGQWEVPVGLDLDQAGNLYIADSANFRVQVLGPDGNPLVVTRANERWYETTRRIYSPVDVAVAPSGRLYVADFAAAKIQRFRIELP